MKSLTFLWFHSLFVLGSILLGLIVHEFIHIWQFGFNVRSISIIWGASPIPGFLVQAGEEVKLVEKIEPIAFLFQYAVTMVSYFLTAFRFQNYIKDIPKGEQ